MSGMQDRPGTGLQLRHLSSTSKNIQAPLGFLSNTSTNQSHSSIKVNSNAFPGSLNYTSLLDYQQGVNLGQGAYATVKQATHKESGMVIAIKIYDKFKLSSNA